MKITRLALATLLLSPAYPQVQETQNRRALKSKASKTSKASKGKTSKASKGGQNPDNPFESTRSLYIMSNAASGNEVKLYERDANTGMIEYMGSFATGGIGAGVAANPDGTGLVGGADPLGASGSLMVAGECVLAVNAGSDTVTSFARMSMGFLRRVGIYDTGPFPTSISGAGGGFFGGFAVYVMGSGGEGSLTGFRGNPLCELEPMDQPTASLGQQDTADPPFFATSPAQVGSTRNPDFLVVQIKGQDNVQGPGTISLYPVTLGGLISGPPTVTEVGPVAFSFVRAPILPPNFSSRNQILANAAGGPTVTNYQVENDGSLTVVGGPVDIGTSAPCWIDVARDGCIVTTNGGGTLSTLRMGEDGSLTLLESMAAQVEAPLDLRFASSLSDPRLLYVLGGGDTPAIYVFSVTDCALTQIQVVETSPIVMTEFGVVGMALF